MFVPVVSLSIALTFGCVLGFVFAPLSKGLRSTVMANPLYARTHGVLPITPVHLLCRLLQA